MKEEAAYTVKALAELAGVTPRTLRYYDQIGLLRPNSLSPSGYRLYGAKEVDLLQQILFYRALGLPLEEIAKTLSDPSFDRRAALREHLSCLCARREQLECLIENVQKTIACEEGKTTMTDKEKFEGFLQEKIAENEKTYGPEIRERFGADTVDKANAKMMKLTEAEYQMMQKLEEEIRAALEKAVASGLSPVSEEGRRIAQLHREWLSYTWPSYTLEAHKGLADGYLADERFKNYYDRKTTGCAAFLRDAIYAL